MTVGPGWFPDPEDAAQLRYWDGQGWTDQRSPAQPAAPQYPQYPAAPPQYGTPYAPGQDVPNESNTLSIIGIVCGAIAFLFCPPLFGLAGLILGGIALSKKERLAPWALGVSGAGLVLGMVIGALLLRSNIYG